MSNFKYEIKKGICYLVFGGNRMRIRWQKRWVPKSESILICPEISLDKESITFTNFVGTETLTATAVPADYSGELVWKSSNTNIATVSDEGVVTPVKYTAIPADKTCVISCSSSVDPSSKATCLVTSNVVVPTSITLNESAINFTAAEQTQQLTATIAPNTAITDLVWSSNNSCVTVSSTGLVTAKSAGTAVVVCESLYDSTVKAVCSVTVSI